MRARASTITAGIILGIAEPAWACPNCATSDEVWSAIRSEGFWPLAVIAGAFALVAVLIVVAARKVHDARLLAGGTLLLGAGLGAFIDGIALHQILQWHEMLSSRVFPGDLITAKINMFWDGVFHLFSWVTALAGALITARGARDAPRGVLARVLTGGLLAGWGLFNLVEGVIDHQILGLHHVHPGEGELAWDLGFLASGALLIAAGAAFLARGQRAAARAHGRPIEVA